jgi:hypothetical protein
MSYEGCLQIAAIVSEKHDSSFHNKRGSTSQQKGVYFTTKGPTSQQKAVYFTTKGVYFTKQQLPKEEGFPCHRAAVPGTNTASTIPQS